MTNIRSKWETVYVGNDECQLWADTFMTQTPPETDFTPGRTQNMDKEGAQNREDVELFRLQCFLESLDFISKTKMTTAF